MIIRKMNLDDIEFAYHCVQKEQWQTETKEMFDALLKHDPNGCFIAEIENEKVGLCVATKYNNYGFIGELIVLKEFRGKGIGVKLFTDSIKYLQNSDIKNIYLDADLDAVPIYEKTGFVEVCKSLRFNGKIIPKKNKNIRLGNINDLQRVIEIDKKLFGDDRSFFLKRSSEINEDLFFVNEINNNIEGYIFGRPGNDVISIGPWVATEKVENPFSLLESISANTKNNILRIGILENNKKAVEFLRSNKSFEEQTYCIRMVLGDSDRLGKSDELISIGSPAKG